MSDPELPVFDGLDDINYDKISSAYRQEIEKSKQTIDPDATDEREYHEYDPNEYTGPVGGSRRSKKSKKSKKSKRTKRKKTRRR